MPDVEVVGGFVEDEEGGLLGEGARDEDALALATGEPVEGAVGQVDGVDREERGVDEVGVLGVSPARSRLCGVRPMATTSRTARSKSAAESWTTAATVRASCRTGSDQASSPSTRTWPVSGRRTR